MNEKSKKAPNGVEQSQDILESLCKENALLKKTIAGQKGYVNQSSKRISGLKYELEELRKKHIEERALRRDAELLVEKLQHQIEEQNTLYTNLRKCFDEWKGCSWWSRIFSK